MDLFFCSEHYEPRVGGVTTYINQTCTALVKLGHNVTLCVPGEFELGCFKWIYKEEGFSVIQLGTGINSLKGKIPSKVRIRFARDLETYLKLDDRYKSYDVVHCFFGFYFMRHFNASFLRDAKIPIGITIHNVPPEECGLSWKDDHLWRYLRDLLRKELVRFINYQRIRSNRFDIYVVPSQIVKRKLAQLVSNDRIYVIGHGLSSQKKLFVDKSSDKIKILTVGGIVPHKNQHLIPRISYKLKKIAKGSFMWDIVGPVRNKNFHKYITDEIKRWGVEDVVRIRENVPFDSLQEYYLNADLYVQPSSEEGFCLTALDAARFGIPIIGTNAGAIPEIIRDSQGTLVNLSTNSISLALSDWMVAIDDRDKQESRDIIEYINDKYSWKTSAQALVNSYATWK